MKVLLISMPFAGVGGASMGLSTLKASLQASGIPCDVQYLNLAFRDYVRDSVGYDLIADYWLLGEWVFGKTLFGREWAQSKRGGTELLSSFITNNSENPAKLLHSLVEFRYAAMSFLDRCLVSIPWEQYGIIGFTSVFSQQISSLALAKRLKELYPEKIIAFGGANCEGEMGQVLLKKFPFVDWVFSGEADISLPQAVCQWREGETPHGISGVSYRHEGEIIAAQNSGMVLNMDDLPTPDLDDYFAALRKYAPDLEGIVPISFEFSRGCWWGAKFQCVFCGLNSQSINYRCKSEQKALQEIEDLTTRYGTRNIRLMDNNLSPGYFQALLPTLGHPGNRLSGMFVETKVNLTRQQLYTLKMAGVRQLQPGIESLDTEMLDYMKKGSTLQQNLRFLKWAKEYNLIPAWNFLHSFPGESGDAYQRMASLIPFLVHFQPPLVISSVIVQRFSAIYNELSKWGIRHIRACGQYHFIYPWEPAELDQVAYRFDYTLEDKMRLPEGYLKPIIRELRNWQQLWQKKEPPLLVLERLENNLGIVYDTRPQRQEMCTKLNTLQTLVLIACDRDVPFSSLAEKVKEQMGSAFPGDCVLRSEIEELEQLHFMIREGERCLSLTNDLNTLAQYSDSMLVKLLYAVEETKKD